MATLHNADDIATQGHPCRRLGVVEKAGDVIPRVVGPVLEQAARRLAAVGDADDMSRVRQPAASRGRGSRVALRETSRARRRLQRGLEHFAAAAR
jgi:NAD-dependent DNA ligase